MLRRYTLVSFLAFFIAQIASAELLFNTAKLKRENGLGVYFMASEVEYENGTLFDVERKIIGGEYAISIDRHIEFVAQAGLIIDAEVNKGSSDGQGFMLGGGARMLMHTTQNMHLIGFGLLNYLNESYDSPVKPKISIIDMHLGATALFPISPSIQPFIGLELALYSNGDVKSDISKGDIERSDLILINAGAIVPLTSTDLIFELTIGGEKTITIGATF